MDPLTIATGIAGFLSLTFEIAAVLKEYISGVKSATSDAGNLLTEIEALNHVLEQLVTFLRSEDAKGNTFNQTSVLCSVIAVCHGRAEYLYRKLEKLFCEDKRIRVMKRIKWPLDKQECQQTVEILHRCTQTFEFSLSISNRFSQTLIIHQTALTYIVPSYRRVYPAWRKSTANCSRIWNTFPI